MSRKYRHQLPFSTLAEAQALNPVLFEGEVWTEKDAITGRSTGRRKVGDGVETPPGSGIAVGTAFNDLPFEPTAGGASLSITNRTATTLTVASDSGADAVIPAASGTEAGLITAASQAKLDGIAANAEVNVNADWNAASGDAQILNKPTLGTAAAQDATAFATAAQGTDAREWTASTVSQAEAEAGTATTRRAFTAERVRQAIVAWWSGSAFATKLAGIADGATANATDAALRDRATHTGTQAATTITGLATVATSGAYGDLSGRPPLGTAAATAATDYAPAAQGVTGGNSHDHNGGDGGTIAYSSLSGLPTLGTAAAQNVGTSAGNVVQLDGSARLPAVDGSQLTGLPSSGAAISGTPVAGQAAEWASGTAIAGVGTTGTGNYVKATAPALSAATVSTSATVTAGSNAQGSGALTSDLNIITTTAANPSGVTLPAATAGRTVVVVNRGTNPVNVYPATGAQIDTAGTNNPYSLAVGARFDVIASSTTQWQSSSIERTSVAFLAGTGTGVNAALAVNVGTAGAFVVNGGALGTPSGGNLANCTGLPAANVTGLGSLATLSALGNITSAGAIGSTATLPVITTTGGMLTTGTFGTTAGTFCQGNDARLSDARTPLAHTHGNISNAGAIGSTANLPIITGTGGVLQVGSFGTTANTFAQGNDSRFHDSVTLGASVSPIFSITGQALGAVDHGADRLLFWDDSAGTLSPLELGTNLSITGTVLNATGGGGGSLTVQDEGTNLSTSVSTINFTGAGVTATGTSTVTVDIPGGGTPADGSVTLPKLADLATQRVIGRNSAGTGVPEAVTISQQLEWLPKTGTIANSDHGSIIYRGATDWRVHKPPVSNSVPYFAEDQNPDWLSLSAIAQRSSGLSQFPAGTTTSAELRTLLSDPSGTGAAYFQGGNLGTPSGGNLGSCTGLPTSGITNFNADTRAQTEAALVAGTNITITPSGTGATRQFTITATGGSASAGGSTTQVQYNSAGALAGAANVKINADNLQLTAPSSTPGAADASSLLVYPVAMADRFMLAMRGPIGAVSLIQPSLFSNNVSMFNPQAGTTGTGSNAFHTAWTSNGTVTHPTPDSSALFARFRRTRYNNVATTQNQQLGPRMNAASDMAYWRGNAANAGGFFFYARFFLAYPASTVRVFAGLQGAGATSSICTSDTVGNNTCGLWHDTTDPSSGSGAFNLVTRNGTTTTKTPINLANAIATGVVYDFTMYHEPNGSTLYYRLDDLNNAVTYTGNTTSTLPVNTVFMSPQVQMSNGTANVTNDTSAMSVVRIYVESPY